MHNILSILYVDDDPDDREMLSTVIYDIDPNINMVYAENGLEALNYLFKLKNLKNNLPCLIILDINMPYLDGRETFTKIKNDPALEKVSIVVFTSSENPNDVAFFKGLGAEFYTKPDNSLTLSRIANEMIGYCEKNN